MSLPTQKPTTTPIPVQLSENECTIFILPHLAMPKRGPKCTLGYPRLFHLILSVLYTGMQWKCLPYPCRQTPMGNRPSTPPPSIEPLPHGPMRGRSGRPSSPVCSIWQQRTILTPVCCMATGPTPSPKKGGWHRVLGVQTPEGGEGHRHHGQPWLCLGSPPRGSRE